MRYVVHMTNQSDMLERLANLTPSERLSVLCYLSGYLGDEEMALAIALAIPEAA